MDVQAEADRLLSLDDDGLEREVLVVALRLGESAKQTWEDLRRMDEGFLNDITNYRERDGSAFEGA